MTPDPDTCYDALRARDPRFDGRFFFAVETTGIYCRPVCPARTPRRDRCHFFPHAAAAERAGFRACLRCRPELAPGQAPSDARPRIVRRAMTEIEAGFLDEASVDDLAASLEVTARHLRRAMQQELGVTPIELAQTRRLAIAKQLLQDSDLSIAEIAFASGFASLRRFNSLFRRRFDCPPSALRKASGRRRRDAGDLTLRLDFRPPMAWSRSLIFLAAHAIPGVERVEGDRYQRSVALGPHRGWLEVAPIPRRSALRARLSLSLAPAVGALIPRLRRLFDLDHRPEPVDARLAQAPELAPLVEGTPGLRVPGAFDPFEMAARAVIEQQISVKAATTISGRLVQALGSPADTPFAKVDRSFPSAARVAAQSTEAIAALGMPRKRAETLLAIARAAERGELEAHGTDPESARAQLQSLPGIGPWTASYLAMRILRWPDAFPAEDLVLQRCLNARTPRQAERRAEAWRPWRAYGAMHLWNSRR